MGVEDHVRDFSAAAGADSADLDDSLRVVPVEERTTASGNDGPCLTNDLGTSGDLDGVGDDVHTSVEEDDLATGVLLVCVRLRSEARDGLHAPSQRCS